ncbi:PhzF family phenazine biosynthesis protein [Ciceribacter sp. L1K23]|uniref:PhzF family phenazine biosynthesis protein n=1 Tax=Ciceribacter sp. L1K23 TaxID=2820276 RepID=UPI001B825057|nr:PhzF family phenazine biosynthesis protein [Ciceribacter sp. L1K23]MBR0558201.1 PhzF family phenazine biosynthesis protein [Ciceribacter sp. L1K23]
MPERHFQTVDVFTTKRFSGNPLAVILDAAGLSDSDMQKIAAEFGYSETTFVLPPEDAANTAAVRIFTPVTEVPFAGHPNVGTAFVIGNLGSLFGRTVGDVLRFEEKAGLVEVKLMRDGARVTGASIRAPGPLTTGSLIEVGRLAQCIRLASDEVAISAHEPVFVSVGLKFIVVELKDLEALGRAAVDISSLAALRETFSHEDCDCALFLYVRCGDGHVRARMFAPFDNVAEDPATGSASAALGAFLAFLDGFTGSRRLFVEQGIEMGRPSRITVDVTSDQGVLQSVSVSGDCVEVTRGSLVSD